MFPIEYPNTPTADNAIPTANTLSLKFYGVISPYPIVVIVIILQ